MIGALEALQLANHFRGERDQSNAFIDRVDARIREVAELDQLASWFDVGTAEVSGEVLARVAQLYSSNGWMVSRGDTGLTWSMRAPK